MGGRRWTAAEDRYLVRWYRRKPACKIAEKLGRSERSVYSHAREIGLAEDRDVASEEQIAECIAKLHPLGLCDADVLRRLEDELGSVVGRHRIGRIRKSMGLKSNAYSEVKAKQAAERTRRQLAAAGVTSMGQLRARHLNEWKDRLGWPRELSIRAVQAAELFYRFGPMTRQQLCVAMGLPESMCRQRTAPKSRRKGGTVMAELMRAGLLMVLRKQVPRGRNRRGGVQMVDLYLLNPGVEPSVKTTTEHTEAV